MKKFYAMMMAAGASVLACSAANPSPVAPAHAQFELNPSVLPLEVNHGLAAVSTDNGMKKLAGNMTAPANLNGSKLGFFYDIVEQNVNIPVYNEVSLTLTETDSEGNQAYTMTGWVDGMYNPSVITILPVQVVYTPATGELVIPAGQALARYQGKDYTIWNMAGEFLWPEIPYVFKYDGDGFVWENPMPVENNETGEVEDFNSLGLCCGYLGEDGVQAAFLLNNFAIRETAGTFSSKCTTNSEVVSIDCPVYTTYSDNVLTIINWAYPTAMGLEVPMTVNAADKTLTAKDVLVVLSSQDNLGNPVDIDCHLSAADPDCFNAAGEGVYELVSKYSCSGDKTFITVPDWNYFYYNTEDPVNPDYNFLYPISQTTIELNFNLDNLVAGVNSVVVDENENAPVEYYNLQGVRVLNPENGLYIRRQGNKATKVIL